MKRRLFKLAAGSLGMMLASVVLWVRSQFACDVIDIKRGRYYMTFVTWPSYAGVDAGWFSRTPIGTEVEPAFAWEVQPVDHRVSALWFVPRVFPRFSNGPTTGPIFDQGRWSVRLPYWFLTLTTGLLSFLCRRHAKKLDPRWRLGRCLTCGYDLRATPERCPECGTAAGTAAAAGEARRA
jgi:hypothetical protein